jgi:hemerythrin superfamily protein
MVHNDRFDGGSRRRERSRELGRAKESAMPPFEPLRKDHQRLKMLLAKLAKTPESAADLRSGLLEKFRHDFQIHGQVEEKLFYPALRALPIEHASLRSDQGFHEHREIDAALERLQAIPPQDPRFAAGVEDLVRKVDRHVRSEERDLFSIVAARLSSELVRQLDRRMKELKSVLSQASVR